MILKSLTLEGIRSYKDETPIAIPVGTTLFEGDIASGKSTILYAIEFALFGLGSMKGTFLLRNRMKQGGVTLRFEVDEREYEVHRTLQRKGKGIQQVDCYIKGPDGKTPLSATELKERILQILRFNEPPNPRAQSVIYRYAIFTPQEEMKEVILKDSDDRLQTLRRAFGIEQYKIATQNTSVVVSKVKGRIGYLQGATRDIEEVRSKLAREVVKIQGLGDEVKPLKKREVELSGEKKITKDEAKELEKVREKIKKAEERIPLLKKAIASTTELGEKLSRENVKLEKRITEELEPRISELRGLKKPTEKTKAELKEELQKLRKKSKEVENVGSKLEERMENFASILEKKVCPVCERKIERKDFAGKLRHLKEEKAELEKRIEKLAKDSEGVEKLVEELGEYETALNELKTLLPTLKEEKDKIIENNKTIKEHEKDLKELKGQLDLAEDEVKPLQGVLKQIEELETKIGKLENELGTVGKRIASIEESIKSSEENQRQLKEDLSAKEKQLNVIDSLTEHRIWLDEYFAPTIENIEKHVMTTLNQRFNQQFQRWFHILMEDPDLQVRVNEDFSPLIEREGYEQEFSALSGGERTSIALAYRLSLNTLVQEVAAGGGTNLLILDEPTDGFSKEQLSKVRDVLTELKCPQVILVSHERELEAFADHVYTVERANGISRVTAQNMN